MARKSTELQSQGPVRECFCQSFVIPARHDDWLTGLWNSLCSDVIMSTVFSHQVKKEIPEVKFDDVPDVSDFDIQKMKT